MTKSLENNTPHWGMHLTAQHGKEVKKGKRKRAPRIERENFAPLEIEEAIVAKALAQCRGDRKRANRIVRIELLAYIQQRTVAGLGERTPKCSIYFTTSAEDRARYIENSGGPLRGMKHLNESKFIRRKFDEAGLEF